MMERAEVKQRVLAIARDIHAVSSSSYGPTGRVKALQPNEDAPDAVELTTNAERICDRIGSSDCPIANVYLHILKSRLRNHCDGGLFTMMLSSKLQLIAMDGKLANIPHLLVSQGYSLAIEWCLAYLEDPACPIRVPVDWSDTEALNAVIRGIVGSKPMAFVQSSASDGHTSLLRMLVEAFVSVLPFVTENPGESLPIRFLHDAAHASSLSKSQLYKNSVLLECPHHAPILNLHRRLPIRNVKVLLFSMSVNLINGNDNTDDSTGVAVDSSEADNDHLYHELANAIAFLDVGVVLSQKVVPESFQSMLASKGIVSIERLGISHMRAVQLLTGATAIGDWRIVHSRCCPVEALGFLSSVSCVEANHKKLLLLENDHARNTSTPDSTNRAWPVATLVLSVGPEFVYAELVHTIKSCFKQLVSMMEESEALAGAGCTEIHLAAWLRRNSQELVCDHFSKRPSSTERVEIAALRRLRTVVNGFAEALESIAVSLDHGVHGMASEVTERLVMANRLTLSELPDQESYSLYGWSPVEGDVIRVVTVSQSQEDGDSTSDSSSDETSGDSDDGSVGDDTQVAERSVVTAWVLDSLTTKREALVAAVECAMTLLRVAGVVHTTPGA